MKKLSLILALFWMPSAIAASSSFTVSGFNISVEPIVGYQFDHRDNPSPHGKATLIYGARVTAGSKLLSAEAEYTRGSDTEVFLNPNQTIKTDSENVKLGLRTTQSLANWLSFLARAGGQASRQKIETIQSGVSSIQDGKWEIRPYAGAGIQGALANKISLTAEAVYVFNDLKDWSRNDIQTTLALKFDINAR